MRSPDGSIEPLMHCVWIWITMFCTIYQTTHYTINLTHGLHSVIALINIRLLATSESSHPFSGLSAPQFCWMMWPFSLYIHNTCTQGKSRLFVKGYFHKWKLSTVITKSKNHQNKCGDAQRPTDPTVCTRQLLQLLSVKYRTFWSRKSVWLVMEPYGWLWLFFF